MNDWTWLVIIIGSVLAAAVWIFIVYDYGYRKGYARGVESTNRRTKSTLKMAEEKLYIAQTAYVTCDVDRAQLQTRVNYLSQSLEGTTTRRARREQEQLRTAVIQYADVPRGEK